ncbi:MAG: EpsI family protein [Planctomycetota bacterium]|jgi:hypothetical protein
MQLGRKLQSENRAVWRAWVAAVVAVLATGVVYRLTASHLRVAGGDRAALPVRLSEFPVQIGGWTGRDVPIAENIQRVAGMDDFLSRLYINQASKRWANVYIAYCARPHQMIGHRPQSCYVGGGWVHDSTETARFVTGGGEIVPCLVHRFHKPAPHGQEIVVLNFYIVNGDLTRDEDVFTGLGWRRPSIAGQAAQYVTQVQISSVLENSARAAAKEMTDLLLDFFPDEKGRTGAREFKDNLGAVVE